MCVLRVRSQEHLRAGKSICAGAGICLILAATQTNSLGMMEELGKRGCQWRAVSCMKDQMDGEVALNEVSTMGVREREG